MTIIDRRASIKPKDNSTQTWDTLFGPENASGDSTSDSFNILYPLRKDRQGVIFPYAPLVTFLPASNWSANQLSHTNYPVHTWSNSTPGSITVTADFTANNHQDAWYSLAAIMFFRGALKGGYGENDPLRGTPPPVYRFNYLGEYQFKNVPVIVSSVVVDYLNNVDYVDVVDLNGRVFEYVPAKFSMIVTLLPQYNIRETLQSFNLADFRTGKLLKNNNKDGYL